MSALPQPRPARARRKRRRHGGALLAALAYGLAGFALYQLVAPSLRSEPPARPKPAVTATPPAQADLGGPGPRDELALRAVASRVQQSVYAVRAQDAAGGSAFVAWTRQGKVSFLLTARSAVTGASGQLLLKHGPRTATARIVAADSASGLAVLRVNAALDRPLWQRPDDRAPLRRGAAAIAVPAGKTGAFGQAVLTKVAHAFSLPIAGGPKYVGAPVLDEDGRLSGVVVDVSSGDSRLVSLADACRRVRDCG
jgi:S1-C subfamily serine protease